MARGFDLPVTLTVNVPDEMMDAILAENPVGQVVPLTRLVLEKLRIHRPIYAHLNVARKIADHLLEAGIVDRTPATAVTAEDLRRNGRHGVFAGGPGVFDFSTAQPVRSALTLDAEPA